MENREIAKLIMNRRRQNAQYGSYMNKRPYFDAIATGNTEMVLELSEKNYKYPSMLFESSDSYTDAMYRMYYDAICAASEMCLIAIQNGLPDMVSYDIRDSYVGEFDMAQSLPDLYDLIHGMAHEFALRVNYARMGNGHSPRLLSMMTYIEEHLYEKISLQDVADAATISRNYASTVFKNELGMTMNEFIMQERIAEAQRLLRSTDLQISEVAERLQFCSQSYFTQCFSRLIGKTPNEYRTSV